jgi:SAM-dependent methyltransferase
VIVVLRFFWKLTPKGLRERLKTYIRRFHSARHAIGALETRQRQIETILQKEHGLILPPPRHLQERVGGPNVNFIAHGYSLRDELCQHLTEVTGKRLTDFTTVLDFGCGCGRVTRPVRWMLGPSANLDGIDIDPEAIAWASENYKGIAEFRVGPAMPPTPFADATFDFIYGISVFSHLPEDMQFAWLAELRRIAKPGAYLALSTHGEKHPEWVNEPALRAKGFLYRASGTTAGLPDFYQGAYHTPEYIHREWVKYFDVLGIAVRALDDWQDIVFIRRPA